MRYTVLLLIVSGNVPTTQGSSRFTTFAFTLINLILVSPLNTWEIVKVQFSIGTCNAAKEILVFQLVRFFRLEFSVQVFIEANRSNG